MELNVEAFLTSIKLDAFNAKISRVHGSTYRDAENKLVIEIRDVQFKRGYGTYPHVAQFYYGLITASIKQGIELRIYTDSPLQVRKASLLFLFDGLKLKRMFDNRGNLYHTPCSKYSSKLRLNGVRFGYIAYGLLAIHLLLTYMIGDLLVPAGIGAGIGAVTAAILSFIYYRLSNHHNYMLFENPDKFTSNLCDFCITQDSGKCTTCPIKKK